MRGSTRPVSVTLFLGAAEEILLHPTPDIRVTRTKSGNTVTTQVSALHADGLGSVRAVTDDAGAVVERTTYRPCGEELRLAQPLTLAETKGFIGERFDDGSGLQSLNARYYDPRLGMFLQPDWWEVAQPGVETNRYSYSFNDPVNGRDPGGNQSWFDPVPGPVWQDNAGVVGGIVVGGIIGGIIMGGRPGALIDLPPIDQRPPPLDPTKVISNPAKSPVKIQVTAPGAGSIVFNEETGEVETEGKLKPGTYVDTETGKIYEVDEDGKIKELGYDEDGWQPEKKRPSTSKWASTRRTVVRLAQTLRVLAVEDFGIRLKI